MVFPLRQSGNSSPRNDASTFVMVCQPTTGTVAMSEVNTSHDVFFSDHGLVAPGTRGWNVGFYEQLQAMVNKERQSRLGSKKDEGFPDDAFIAMIIKAYHAVKMNHGKFYLKLSRLNFAVWEELNEQKSYPFIARCIRKLSQSVLSARQTKDDWIETISRQAATTATPADVVVVLDRPTDNRIHQQPPIIAYYTTPSGDDENEEPPAAS